VGGTPTVFCDLPSGDDAGAHRIQFDISSKAAEVVRLLDDYAFVAALPDRPVTFGIVQNTVIISIPPRAKERRGPAQEGALIFGNQSVIVRAEIQQQIAAVLRGTPPPIRDRRGGGVRPAFAAGAPEPGGGKRGAVFQRQRRKRRVLGAADAVAPDEVEMLAGPHIDRRIFDDAGTVAAGILNHQAFRLKRMDMVVEFGPTPALALSQLPVGGCFPLRIVGPAAGGVVFVPAAVEPHLQDRAVAGQQFGQLRLHVVDVGPVAVVVGKIPVPKRVVKAGFESGGTEGVDKSCDNVDGDAGVLHRIIGTAARPKAEPVMMLGGQDRVLHARLQRNFRPLAGVQPAWGEFRRREPAVAPADTGECVDSKVDEHSEPEFFPVVPGKIQYGGELRSHDHCSVFRFYFPFKTSSPQPVSEFQLSSSPDHMIFFRVESSGLSVSQICQVMRSRCPDAGTKPGTSSSQGIAASIT